MNENEIFPHYGQANCDVLFKMYLYILKVCIYDVSICSTAFNLI